MIFNVTHLVGHVYCFSNWDTTFKGAWTLENKHVQLSGSRWKSPKMKKIPLKYLILLPIWFTFSGKIMSDGMHNMTHSVGHVPANTTWWRDWWHDPYCWTWPSWKVFPVSVILHPCSKIPWYRLKDPLFWRFCIHERFCKTEQKTVIV